MHDGGHLDVDPFMKEAILVEGASFTWHQSASERAKEAEKKKEKGRRSGGGKEKEKGREMRANEDEDGEKGTTERADAEPFKIVDISLNIQRGSVAAIVGPVGSGKVRRIVQLF